MDTDTMEMEQSLEHHDTFTFTARNIEDPSRLATFTLQNGSVAVQLGDALIEQIESTLDSLEEEQKTTVRSWLKPAATGATQAVMNPIPVRDFNANLTPEGNFRTTAWVRAGGLRLAPISINWQQVDNPQGASAFVDELERRQEITTSTSSMPSPFDYWATWVLVGAIVLSVPFIIWRFLSGRKQE